MENKDIICKLDIKYSKIQFSILIFNFVSLKNNTYLIK